MSPLPLVYLAFANAQDAHLALLKAESRDIYRALTPLEEAGQIAVQREESSERKELYDDLVTIGDRLVIFHYAGHANGKLLQLEDGGQSAVGLARLLGQLRSLKLVFLNGCATLGHVRLLRDAGVPAVIATSVPIGDQKAHEFSSAFYTALAKGKSIADAFDAGRGFLEGKGNGGGGFVATRDVDMGSVEAPADDSLALSGVEGSATPWGLFTREDAAQDLAQWRLPTARADWSVQLEDWRGPLRDLSGAPQVVDYRLPVRVLAALSCRRCGAASTAQAGEASPSCPVCGSIDVASSTASTMLCESLVAFGVSEDQARAAVRKVVPALSAGTVQLRRLYVPFWVFDVDTRTTFEGECGWNRALGEVVPRLEWEPVKGAIDLPVNAFLAAAAAVPRGEDAGKVDWYWELGRAEALSRLDPGMSYALLDRPMQQAFSEASAAIRAAVDEGIGDRIGGHQRRNISSDTRYRRIGVRSVMLPCWYAHAGGAALVVNGQTGAVRNLTLPAAMVQGESPKTRGLDEDPMPNIERTYERGAPTTSGIAGPSVSVFSGAGIGVMIGVLLALSASPTVGIFIGALGSGLAALLGLNDSSFSNAKGLRIGSLGFAVLVGIAIGLYARTHDVLAPSLDAQRREYVALGFSDREALDILKARRLGTPLPVGGAPSAEGKPAMTASLAAPAGNTLLFSGAVELSACSQLQDTGYDKQLTPDIVIGNFQLEKGWKALADATRLTLTGNDQKQLLFIARDAVCGFNGLHPPNVSAAQCRDLESQFASVTELQSVDARVRKEITTPGQPAARKLLAGVFCPTDPR